MKKRYLNSEFDLIYYHLTKKTPLEQERNLYAKGVEKLKLELSEVDERILKTILKQKFLLPYINCGLSFLLKESALRKRFVLVASIVECNPINSDLFLNKISIFLPKLRFILIGIKLTCIITISFILFKVKGWK